MNNTAKNIVILVSYHKKDQLIKDDVLTPINAGRSIAISKNNPDLQWLLDNCLGDDSGDNISYKNEYYNEMTSIYWAWKNYEQLGNPQYIGHFHYRRHLCFKNKDKSVYEFGDLDESYLEDKLGYDPKEISKLCLKYDLIVPKTQWRASAYEHYKRNFDIADLDLAIKILNEKHPDYSESAKEYLKSTGLFFCNIFIMKKELFMEYCDFIFDILQTYEKYMNVPRKRMYISEWITGIFIYQKIKQNVPVLQLPTAIAQGKITIPVIFASDNNYATQMCVAITSLLMNSSSSTFYDIRCIITKDFTQNNKNKISVLKTKFPQCRINFYLNTDVFFKNVKINTAHLTSTAFFRLVAAELFPDIDKAIYLDDDVIVCEDLSILYRYSLDDNYIAGIKAPGYQLPIEWKNKKLDELKIPTMDCYINSGVLLMNLKKIRDDNKVDEFIKLSNNNYGSEDQDVLNVSCYGKIRTLPFRFNVQTKYLDPQSTEHYKLEQTIPSDEIKDAINHPTIIHYADKNKPWTQGIAWGADKWFEYAKQSPVDFRIRTFPQGKKWLINQLSEEIKEKQNIVMSDKNILLDIPKYGHSELFDAPASL